MERSDDESSPPVTVNESLPFHHHHHPSSSADVITCSGDGEEVASGTPMQCVDFATCSQVSSCHRQEGDGHCGGGATRDTDHHLDEPTSQVDMNPVTLASDCDTQDLRALTSDPLDVNCDDDAFMMEPPPLGELTPPTTMNTFECGRRQSAPGQLVQDDPGSGSELQSRRPGIVEYFSR